MIPTPEPSEGRDLSTVAVVSFSHAPEVMLHRNQLLQNGGVEIKCPASEGLSSQVLQKFAIIFDETTGAQIIQEATQVFETFLNANPEVSVRFFYLKWNEIPEQSNKFHHLNGVMKAVGLDGILARFRIIDATKVAPYDLPIQVNRALYKSRLPLFLRTGYDVEVDTELQTIEGIDYRPIVITKHQPSEIDRALEYSGYAAVVSNEPGNRWAYTVGSEGRLTQCEWTPEIQKKFHTLNGQKAFGLYNKEFDRFYRIHGGDDITEIHPEKTRIGKPDHRTVGLFIHNKKLFLLGPDGIIKEITENDHVTAQKCDNPTRLGRLPLQDFKTSEEEE